MPMWLWHTIFLVIGVAILAIGGEALVRGAARLARALGISTLVVGLTVVAFGTSAPEAAVTVYAAMRDSPELAVGNVVGSNIANILLILGLAALVRPLEVSQNLIRFDGPVMVLAVALLGGVAIVFGEIRWPVGAAFVGALLVYTLGTYFVSHRSPLAGDLDAQSVTGLAARSWYNIALVVVGIAGLVGGANFIVRGATGLAEIFGVPEHIIGLTIVAIGTSLPELATAVAAARQKQPDIAIGNVVGSNIFNVFFVTGIAAVFRPLPVPESIVRFDVPLMVLICVIFYPVAFTGRRIVRWEGAVLLAGYVAYLGWNAMQAS